MVGPDAAEDVTQDALVRAWRELPRLRDPERFVAWTRRILVNIARDAERRSRRREGIVRIEPLDDASGGGGDPSQAADRVTDLMRAMASLPVDQRAVVALHYLADLTLVDVAATLRIPVGTAKSRLHAGLGVLRSELGDAP